MGVARYSVLGDVNLFFYSLYSSKVTLIGAAFQFLITSSQVCIPYSSGFLQFLLHVTLSLELFFYLIPMFYSH
jgi:hypothetical protein